MMERPLLTADELKSIPKGSFIVQKTGCHPMRTRLRLFLEWGITFEEEYRVEEQAARKVYYADQDALTRAIVRKYPPRAVSAYMYLKDRSNSAGSCWPGIKTIAREMNLSRSTVKRALADLERHGYLAKLPRYRPNGSNTSNLYTLK